MVSWSCWLMAKQTTGLPHNVCTTTMSAQHAAGKMNTLMTCDYTAPGAAAAVSVVSTQLSHG
jgi:hypothetical protein